MRYRTKSDPSLIAEIIRRLPLLLFLLPMLLVLQANPHGSAAAEYTSPKSVPTRLSIPNSPAAGSNVFLPFIRGGVPQIQLQPILLGSIPVDQYLGTQSVVDQLLTAMDSWAGLSHAAGKGHSIAGTFLALEDPNAWYNVPQVLNTTWNSNYTAFINLTTNTTSASIASGARDGQIQAWADAYLAWTAQGGNRRAFIAPLQEMNGNWTSWGMDPNGFKSAYQRIKNIFEQRGVTRAKLWWVFAPNGWTTPPYAMRDYYPGDSAVDIIAYSAYNQSCRATWETPTQVFQWTSTIRTTVSATKPIFIAQTASASVGGNKDQWMRDAYTHLYQQGIRAVIYFNGNKECDWAVYRPDQGAFSQGYKDAVASPNTRYIAPATLAGTVLPP